MSRHLLYLAARGWSQSQAAFYRTRSHFERWFRIEIDDDAGYLGFKTSHEGMAMTVAAFPARSNQATDTDIRWQAVLSRDRRHDGAFVYAVRSTRVFCRPSCPSRRPRRDQAVFFSAPDGARNAGFRACRRCDPEGVDQRVEIVRRVCRALERSRGGPPSLAALGAQAGLAPQRLQRLFKSVMGVTPRQYADACRLDRFKAQVRDGMDLTSSLYEAGYGSSSRLYERARAQLGMTPASYRQGGKGATISFAIVESTLGRLMVAMTDFGICAVRLGDDDDALEAELRREFFAAEIHRTDALLTREVRQVLDFLGGDKPTAELPLDIRATVFQRRVWEYLRSIPRGQTQSYRQVAEAIGQPAAVRAVARACAANPVALLIPCHRVVRQDGQPGGYWWGAARKAVLLTREGRPT